MHSRSIADINFGYRTFKSTHHPIKSESNFYQTAHSFCYETFAESTLPLPLPLKQSLIAHRFPQNMRTHTHTVSRTVI